MKRLGKLRQTFGLLLFVAALLYAAAPALPADEHLSGRVRIEQVEIGIAGNFKVGHWTPVVVTLSADQAQTGRLTLVTVDADGLSTRYVDPGQDTVELRAGSTRLERCVQFGNASPQLTVEFASADGTVTRRHFASSELPTGHLSTSEFLVVVGSDLDVSAALGFRQYRIKRVTHVIEVPSLDQLPQRALAFDAVDVLLLSTRRIEAAKAAASLTAVRDWLLLGGRAVISCGQQGEALFGPDGPLAPVAPGQFEQLGTLRRTAALETFAGSTQRLEDARLDMAQFGSVRGEVVASEEVGGAEQPLIVHYPVGFGQVSLVTVDLDAPPLDQWSGRSRLLARILAFHQPGETGKGQGSKSGGVPEQLGYDDLAGQLRTALDQFSGARLVPFSWVAGLIAAYILLIGPADYFLVRFGLQRMQATWLTLALVSVGFVALAWWIDSRLKSDSIALNEASVLDVDLEAGVARTTTWTHIYSPVTATYDLRPDLRLPTNAAPQPPSSALSSNGTSIIWQGLPGAGLGGLDGRAAPVLFDSPYAIAVPQHAGQASIERVPVQTASTKGFVTQSWRNTTAEPQTAFQATDDGLIVGKFVYDFDLELEQCAILYDRFLFRIPGKVSRGRTIELTPTSSSRNLLYYLTQKRVIDAKEIVTPWEPRGNQAPRILEMMLLHEAAGGDNYTGLTHRYRSRLDLSDHLVTGRAMLIGRTREPLVAWQGPLGEAPRDQSWTIVRIVIPVVPASPSS